MENKKPKDYKIVFTFVVLICAFIILVYLIQMKFIRIEDVDAKRFRETYGDGVIAVNLMLIIGALGYLVYNMSGTWKN
jgi:hypothetical protein